MLSIKMLRVLVSTRISLNQHRKISSNMALFKQQAYVNGSWVSSSDKRTFDVLNPADNTLFGVVPNMSTLDVQVAIDKAHDSFKTWRDTTAKERAQHLRNWYECVARRTEEIARVMTLESGKPINESRAEVAYGNSYLEFYSEEARRVHGEILQSPVKHKQMFLTKQPIGVVGLITPWNFPFAMLARKASAALAAGCTCVVKPAEDTPLTALALAKIADEVGIPPGVFNVVTCDRDNAPSIGNLLCTSPKVAGISFTGSTEVGRKLYSQCATGIKRIGLELGGNAPFIVFPTANVDKAVIAAIQAKFRNCGQTCVSANRFFVHSSIYDEFISKLKKGMEGLVIGFGLNEEVNIGPLINEQQITKVDNFVNDAVNKGAEVLCGGNPLPKLGELYYTPTLLINISKDMRVYKEEVFGPVAAVMKFDTEEQVITMANDSSRGLAGYFFSQDISQIFRVAKHLDVGMVGINEGLISSSEAAFGGIKESGLGREGSHYGIDDYVYIKYLCLGNLG